jgi:hypothetical protein
MDGMKPKNLTRLFIEVEVFLISYWVYLLPSIIYSMKKISVVTNQSFLRIRNSVANQKIGQDFFKTYFKSFGVKIIV